MIQARQINETYRQHQLVARPGPAGYRGVVWKEKVKTFEAAGATFEDVVALLKEHVDSTYVEIVKARTADPSVQEYVHAFQSIMADITPAQVAMLKAHYQAPEQTITPSQLAEAANYKGWQAANLHYGKLGFSLHDHVPTELPTLPDGTPVYTFVLATEGLRTGTESEWPWKLRPEVASALEQLSLHK